MDLWIACFALLGVVAVWLPRRCISKNTPRLFGGPITESGPYQGDRYGLKTLERPLWSLDPICSSLNCKFCWRCLTSSASILKPYSNLICSFRKRLQSSWIENYHRYSWLACATKRSKNWIPRTEIRTSEDLECFQFCRSIVLESWMWIPSVRCLSLFWIEQDRFGFPWNFS